MKYYAVHFTLAPNTEAARDILACLCGEIGFESFEDSKSGLNGYIQHATYDETRLRQVIQDFPMTDVQIAYQTELMEEHNWNAAWEEEGFEPIVVDDRCVIYDARHHSAPPFVKEGQMSIGIEPVQAFGTGTHETTQMIVAELLQRDCQGRRIVDCGCGTGILSIVAAKCGASEVIAYDIDEWSVDNTHHNAQLNGVENIEVLHGDIHILSHVEGLFDIVTANINRNILLEDLPTFKDVMHEKSILILSGFYENDAPILVEKAQELGLSLQKEEKKNRWCMLVFELQE